MKTRKRNRLLALGICLWMLALPLLGMGTAAEQETPDGSSRVEQQATEGELPLAKMELAGSARGAAPSPAKAGRKGTEKIQYTVTVDMLLGSEAWGTVSPMSATVPEGGSQTLLITPKPGEGQLSYLKVDGKVIDLPAGQQLDQPYSYTLDQVTANHRVEVKFDNQGALLDGIPDDLFLEVGQGERISPDPVYGSWQYDEQYLKLITFPGGETVHFRALKAGNTTVTYTALNGKSKTILVEIGPSAPDRRTIYTAAGPGGQIDYSNDWSVPLHGTKTFQVIPQENLAFDEGYSIDQVFVDGVEVTLTEQEKREGYSYTFSDVTEHHDLTATFVRGDFEISGLPDQAKGYTCYVGEEVMWKPEPIDGGFLYDQEIISCVKDDRFYFVKGLKVGTTRVTYGVHGKRYHFDIKVKPDPHTITASAEPGGSISPSGDVPVDVGEEQTFKVTPEAGYKIDKVLVDGEDVTGQLREGGYTFPNVQQPHTIRAFFVKDKAAGGGGQSQGGQSMEGQPTEGQQGFKGAPATGDTRLVWPWLLLMAAAVAGIGVADTRLRRKKQ